MNQLTALLLKTKPVPIPSTARYINQQWSANRSTQENDVDLGDLVCHSCSRLCTADEMHVRKDGELGSWCIRCTAQKKARQLEREEIVEPDKTARRIAKGAGLMIINKYSRFYVYRKTGPRPTFCGSRTTPNALLVFVKKLAACK